METDLIGIGFGPANLALAIALAETPAARRLSRCFIERQPEFCWHRDMLLEGSTVQISFLKDLATLRDPTSPFTFVNYLHAKGRLASFVNLNQNHPTRAEFNDYFRWAAAAFEADCRYGETVEAVEPLRRQGRIARLLVRSKTSDGTSVERIARDLVVAVGGRANIPAPFDAVAGERVVHSSRYLGAIESLTRVPGSSPRIAVVGGGQSGAEIFHDVIQRFPGCEATLILRGQALRPADDSPFVNEIFDPAFVDRLHTLSGEARGAALAAARNTNYSVVDTDLIERLYALLYRQKVAGCERHRILFDRSVEAAAARDETVEVDLADRLSGERSSERFDIVILATGYRYDTHQRLLAALSPEIPILDVDRFYRLKTPSGFGPGIYLQGASEASHGLSDTLLSIMAVRAREIADDILLHANPSAVASAS